MGRTFLVEESLKGFFEEYFTKTQPNIGIIVGQQNHSQKDYVCHAVVTPKDEEQKGGGEKAQSLSLESIAEDWVVNHAKQVHCMMPGGLSVLGIFAIGSPEQMVSAPSSLRQVLFAVFKTLEKLKLFASAENEITEKVVLQMCSLTKKVTCRTYDTADMKSTAKPADWKYQNIFSDSWIKLCSNVAVDFSIPVTNEMGKKSLKKQIQTGIMPTCENFMNSLAVVNNHYYDDSELLVDATAQSSPGSGAAGKCKKKSQKDRDVKDSVISYDVELYRQMPPEAETEKPKVTECCAKMYVRGTMCCRAYVHHKITAGDAIQALKRDICLTLYRRCELLCEDMLLDEEEQDPRILYETPRRILAPLPETPLEICDYVFVDETAQEIQGRIKELLGIQVEEEDILMDIEKLPEDTDLLKPDNSKLAENSVPDMDKMWRKPKGSLVTVVAGSVIAFLAAAVAYMYTSET